ncbi:transcription activator of gluconeogenesis [Xylogone sp. PMI_703]|nr:transcription activator of gluconeogenesis [Xylogone sp. PMI_703]
MPGNTEIEGVDISDEVSENEYSEHEHEEEHEHEHEPDSVGKDDTENADMAEQKIKNEDENGQAVKKPKYDPKDPLRPRRKKARRACFACQRAHLTCGDERPCQRCIKRGLADACQDGVRKKAKYLHDAPPEALGPVLGPAYAQLHQNRTNGSVNTNTTTSDNTAPGINTFFPPADTFPVFSNTQQSGMPPPQAQISFTSQQSPLSPTFTSPISRRSTNPLQSLTGSNEAQSTFNGPLFDPSNPALFNFDLEGLNFDNHYGALEFGMLGHMSSGAAETPPQDNRGSISQQSVSDVGFNGSVYNNAGQFGPMYPNAQDAMLTDYPAMDQQGKNIYASQIHHGLPHAYSIATGPASMHSPSTDASPQPSLVSFDTSPTATTYTPSAPNNHSRRQHEVKKSSKLGPAAVAGSKRSRDPSSIYDTVKEPYPYTMGFHRLTAFVQRRFSANKTLKIAKSLASIRPSFISCTKTLNRQDLIFMEKCFQRTLFEYEDFMLNCCTPTIVCRRTGEIAAVNNEFTLLTGWKQSVLLGNEPNLNINTGRNSSDANSSGPGSLNNTGKAGLTTPRIRPIQLGVELKEGPHPVFVAELMDDDSVIDFYEDFARLAFGDSRGSVTAKCKLLKYQTKEDLEKAANEEAKSSGDGSKSQFAGNGIGGMGNRVREIDGEHGIARLQKDGKLDCSYCWTVRRDVFDIPMLIVMNFLPCI